MFQIRLKRVGDCQLWTVSVMLSNSILAKNAYS